MSSILYGSQTVLLLAVARRLGMGAGGYGYLFASIGVGGLIGTGLAGRAARCPHPRYVLATALVALGLPMPLLAVDRLAGPGRHPGGLLRGRRHAD
jgi:predicted MFS family arabinose efflux permease